MKGLPLLVIAALTLPPVADAKQPRSGSVGGRRVEVGASNGQRIEIGCCSVFPADGVKLKAKSKNPDYDDFWIYDTMDF